jgi:chromosome partitioning protein
MDIISIINYKGGVGKTTLTTNIAGDLAQRGYNVLMIDLDPQASLTFSFLKPDEWKEKVADKHTIKNWFSDSKKVRTERFEDLIITPHTVKETLKNKWKLDLVSSHLELINVDLELATKLGGANMTQAKEQFIKVHRRLLDGINQLPDDAYDIILIDCPPNFNIVTKNAIVASNYILIPAKPDYLSTMGIDYLKNSLDKLVKEYNEYVSIEDSDLDDYEPINPQILGVVFTMVQYYGEKPISALRPFIYQTKQLGFDVFEDTLRENKTLFADAAQYGVPVVISKRGLGINVIDGINGIVNELLDKLGYE